MHFRLIIYFHTMVIRIFHLFLNARVKQVHLVFFKEPLYIPKKKVIKLTATGLMRPFFIFFHSENNKLSL